MTKFLFYFFIFFIYSISGWIIEMTFSSIYHKKIVDRGFLIGPYCPIYGVAAILMIIFLQKYKGDLIVLFVMAVVISSILEYSISYMMEKLFKARWWDYSTRPFNINGRICLLNCFAFGFLGIILIEFVHPFVENLVLSIPSSYFYWTTGFCFGIFCIDFVASFLMTLKLKETIQYLKKDNTEEISKKVREKIAGSSKLLRRILSAFPNLTPLSQKKKKKSFFHFH